MLFGVMVVGVSVGLSWMRRPVPMGRVGWLLWALSHFLIEIYYINLMLISIVFKSEFK